jgi:hypothetical protein
LETGIIDPVKVTRTALQNAASIAGLMLTTEALISELPEEGRMPTPVGVRSFAEPRPGSYLRSQFRLSQPVSVQEDAAEERVRAAEAYAVARIRGHEGGEVFYMGVVYVVEAGLLSHLPEGFEGAPVHLPAGGGDIDFDIVVHAEDMEIEPGWEQVFTFKREREAPLLEFRLKPVAKGPKIIRVEFLYHGHWLATIRFEVVVIAAPHAVVGALQATVNSQLEQEGSAHE